MAAAVAQPVAPTAVRAVLERDLVYVTGKGGAGKTTVAGAHDIAAGATGRRAIVCELSGAHRLARSFSIDPRDGDVTSHVGRGLDLIVVNGVYPDRFTDAEAEQMRELDGRSGKLRAALEEHDRARTHATRVQWLRQRIAAPVVTLPFVFTTEIGPREHKRLALRLAP